LSAALDGKLAMARAARHLPDLGFDVLAGHSGNLAMASLGKDVIASMLGGLRDLPYDDIVLDLGAGLDHATRLLAASAETLVVLATDEPTSLTDAYAVIKVHAADTQAAGRGDVRIVVNQAGSVAAGQRTYATLARACSHFLQRTPPLAGIVRRDDRVRDAIRRQTPLLTRHPGCQAALDMEHLAAALAGPG
jgi:flagellar biosynthesis protein FlhG